MLKTNVKPDPALGVGDRLERGRRYLVVIQPGPSIPHAVAEGTSRLFCDVHRKRGNQCHNCGILRSGNMRENRVTPSNRRPPQQGPDYEDGSRLEPSRRRALI